MVEKHGQQNRVERAAKGVGKAIEIGSKVVGNIAFSSLGLSFLFGAFGHSAGIYLSLPIPFTHAHMTWAGAVGDPAKLTNTFPKYLLGHINNLHDGLGGAEGWHWGFMGADTVGTVGNQPGGPLFDWGIKFG